MSNESGGRNARVLAAGFVGNVLEWYDFAVYGFFAPTIGKLSAGDRDAARQDRLGAPRIAEYVALV